MGELAVWLIVGAFLWIVIAAIWKMLLFVAIAAAVIFAGRLTFEAISARIRRAAALRQSLIDRAEQQHQMIMSGDEEGGTYGDYLPPPALR